MLDTIRQDGMRRHFINYFKALFLFPISLIVFLPFVLFGAFLYALLTPIAIFSPSLSSFYYKHSFNISLGVDQLASAFTFGNVDQTISGRLGYAIYHSNKDYVIFVILCKILSKFFRQSHHCRDAIEFDRL